MHPHDPSAPYLSSDDPMPTDPAAPPPAAPDTPRPAAAVQALSPWEAMAQVGPRGWMVVGGIAAAAAAIGGMLGAGWHRSPLIPLVLVAVMVVSGARMGWGWLRGRSRRARLREGVLSRVEQYGGGVYGTGAGITLLILTIGSLGEEWAKADGVMDFLRGMSVEWWMGFSADSIQNAVQAGMWPMHWYAEHGWLAALAVGAAAWAGDALADAWRRREPAPPADAGGDAEAEAERAGPVLASGGGAR